MAAQKSSSCSAWSRREARRHMAMCRMPSCAKTNCRSSRSSRSSTRQFGQNYRTSLRFGTFLFNFLTYRVSCGTPPRRRTFDFPCTILVSWRPEMEDKDVSDDETPCPTPREGMVGIEMLQMGDSTSNIALENVISTAADNSAKTVSIEEETCFMRWKYKLTAVFCILITLGAVIFVSTLFYRDDGNSAGTTTSSAPVAVTVQTVKHQAASPLFHDLDSSTPFIYALTPCFICAGGDGDQYGAIYSLKVKPRVRLWPFGGNRGPCDDGLQGWMFGDLDGIKAVSRGCLRRDCESQRRDHGECDRGGRDDVGGHPGGQRGEGGGQVRGQRDR